MLSDLVVEHRSPGWLLVSPLFMMADYKRPEDVETAQRHWGTLGDGREMTISGNNDHVSRHQSANLSPSSEINNIPLSRLRINIHRTLVKMSISIRQQRYQFCL